MTNYWALSCQDFLRSIDALLEEEGWHRNEDGSWVPPDIYKQSPSYRPEMAASRAAILSMHVSVCERTIEQWRREEMAELERLKRSPLGYHRDDSILCDENDD